MKKSVLMLVNLFALVISPLTAEISAHNLDVADLKIQIMPEHDLPAKWPNDVPAVLVGYYGAFVNSGAVEFDDRIEMTLPVNEPNFIINMVCETEAGMVCLPYDIDRTGEAISWRLSRPIQPGERMPFMLEYYSNPFASGSRKELNISPVFSTRLGAVDVEITEPARSSDFGVLPQPQRTLERDGFLRHQFSFDSVQGGEPLAFRISYIKEDNRPSVGSGPPQAAAANGAPSGRGNSGDVSLTAVMVIGGSIIVFGVLLFIGLRTEGRKRQVRSVARPGTAAKGTNRQQEQKKARKLLLEGKISENTYKKLMKEI